jgi:uncharacterized membrane protein
MGPAVDELLRPRTARFLAPLVRLGLLRADVDEPTSEPSRNERRRIDPALATVLAITAVWIVVFGRLIYQRHARYGTFDFDLGIHDQAIWLMTHHGHGFLTVRGIPALGHHATFAYWLFAPFYWLGAGAQFIDLAQVVSLGAVAVFLFLIGRDRMRSSWHAVPFAFAWLAHPSTQWLVWEAFHPEVMAIVWVVAAYWFASNGRWRWYWACVVIALCWKEDIGLAVMMLGIVMLFWRQRRRAYITIGLGAAWFVLMSMVLMPHLTGHGTHAGTFYGSLGNSTSEVAFNSVKHPGVVIDRLDDNNALGYANRINEPFGYTGALSPLPLLIGAPQAMISMLSTAYFVIDPRYHYVVVPLVAAALAMVEGVSRIRPRRIRTALGCLIIVTALMASRTNGVSPISRHYDEGFWPKPSARNAVLDTAVDVLGDHDGVAATWNLVPHLTHRERIYTYPNPWRVLNWGVAGEDPHPTTNVNWLILDLTKVGPDDRAIYDDLIASGSFVLDFDRDQVIVAHRVGDTNAAP